ncbi:MAG: MarR family transcriptional regulator [Erysipelotrichaceae bacterium]|nr:MarR family transcriptional regulator [Erysipelotrichaceae bacterium]
MKDESCMILLKQINDGLEKFSNNIVKEEGLTFTQINVMNLLAKSKRGEMTMKEIEKELHVAQPTVVGIVKRLSQKDIVNTFADETNKKIRHVKLTDKGAKLAGYAEEQLEKVEDELLKDLEKKEVKKFIKLLTTIRKSLD